MDYTQLGRTGLTVSRLCPRRINFGFQTTEVSADVIMDKTLESGIKFFDTANVYGRKMGKGFSEQVICPRTVEQLTGPGGEAPEANAW